MDGSGYEPPAPMTREQQEQIALEDKYRRTFAENPSDPSIQDPHLTLINVFENTGRFDYAEETPEEKRVPKLLTQNRKLGMTGSAIVTRDEFMRGWNEFTGGILNGMDWANVFCAGGAILGNLAKDRTGYSSSDIDLFIYGIHDDEEANRKLRHIHQVVTNNTRGRGDVIRTARAVTILNSYPYRHVQIILRMYKSPAEVLLGFDIDSCTVGFDGRDVWCMPRFQRALTKRYNLVNISRRSLTYEQRLYKYSKRGFAVAVPNLDKSRISSSIFQKRLRDVGGLAKLVLYDYQAQRQATGTGAGGFGGFGAGPRFGRNPIGGAAGDLESESSDYNGDLNIPWGPGLQAEQIMRVLNVKDKKQFFAKLNKAKKGDAGQPSQQRVRPSHLFEKIFLDQSGNGNQKPIEWIKNNPAYQDYDNGFKRQLMTGSFHPPALGENWEEGAYADASTAAAAPGTLSNTAGRPASSFDASSSSSPKMTATKASPATTTYGFGGISTTAPSQPAAAMPAQKQPAFGASPFSVKAKKTESAATATAASPSPAKAVATSTATGSGFSLAGYYAAVTQEEPAAVPTTTTPAATANRGGSSGFTGVITGGGTSLAALDRHSPPPQPGGSISYAAPPTAVSYSAPQPGGSAFVGFATPAKSTTSQPAVGPSPGLAAFGPQPGASYGGAPEAAPRMLESQPATHYQHQPHYQQQQQQHHHQPQQGSGASSAVLLAPRDDGEAKPSTKLLLLVALLFKQGRLSQDERGKLKDLVILRNDMVFAALEVFELDQDLDELVDTFKRVCRLA